MQRRAILLLFAMLPLVGQQSAPSVPVFRVLREVTKTAAAEAVTVQLPKNATKRAELLELFISCEADIDVTIEQNGGAATSTSMNPSIVNLIGASAVATPFHTSNTIGGTVIDKFTIYGGGSAFINLSGINLLSGQNTPQNLTFRTTSFTGLLRIRVQWQERP